MDTDMSPFEWLTSPASLRDLLDEIRPGRVLHVGSGNSALGEYLVETFPSIAECVNVDVDLETLNNMQQRWLKRCNTRQKDRLKFVHADLSCLGSLDQLQDCYFDLILDKSTLDCLLCSENGTTGLLTQVNRLLAVGGTYLVITFHQLNFIRPLLEDLPDADWDVHHSVMKRQVEDLVTKNSTHRQQVSNGHNNRATSAGVTDDGRSVLDGTTAAPKLNVFRCVRRSVTQLDAEKVHQHILTTNNQWFQAENPMMTLRRVQDLNTAFAGSKALTLQQAYQVLFTAEEREHLTYESFLEDWRAYVQDKRDVAVDFITLETAVAFLEAMQ
jgi:ubiquinone/menaquinone biosynthesis C-methylase UbiE